MQITDVFLRVPLSAIVVDREGRQRQEIDTTDIDSSIEKNGVLIPIIVEEEAPGRYRLIAGERRYTSSLKLGLADIPVRLLADLSAVESQIVELEENIKRKDLPWRDYARAIDRIHKLHLRDDPEWTQQQTASSVGLDFTTISTILRVARDLDNPKIAACNGLHAAYNVLSRLDSRRMAAIVSDMLDAVPGSDLEKQNVSGEDLADFLEEEAAAGDMAQDEGLEDGPYGLHDRRDGDSTSAPSPGVPSDRAVVVARARALSPALAPEGIINANFLEWAPKYSGPRFNFLHCDFPYGINFNAGSQGGRNDWSGYDDSPDVYWTLLQCLADNVERLLLPSSHIVFWFSMDLYRETLDFFEQKIPLISLRKRPLYWHKTDNVGVLPDPRRGPREVVETFLMGSMGDRKVVKPVSNAYGAPTDKALHQSTKPEPMLRHFFQMFVDETTRLLDPTCGSGSALRAAESLGAEQVYGLEMNPEHAEASIEALRTFRRKREMAR
jgi:ParB/RepB/Spo0J family partition protein